MPSAIADYACSHMQLHLYDMANQESAAKETILNGAQDDKQSYIVGSLKLGDAYPYSTALRKTFMLLDLQLCMSCAGIAWAA